ncbi:MAG: hypothetical protein ISR25_05525 [Candidatus Poseidoniaceae archaeon]|nr:hypothetical protein [Candidatus Poseidoniaceae archaeon]MBL6889933.1 hypothetical protein [Candidatus Poseidoniaceae archaeon]
MVTYVVDSNCFIHMGAMGSTTLLKDLKSSLKTMHVTDGVHGEIRTVRFQRWKQRPNLLEQVKPLLTTHSVDDGQIRGLASKIGERASPQDVDLSLMVLSSSLQREGHDVLLVTDDFKMAKATEEHQLAGEVCPPSTFFERIAKSAKGKHASELRRLGRRIRAAEMQYAISRRNEYDVQAKITWMVDSLLATAPAKVKASVETQANEGQSVDYLHQLGRHLSGEDLKTSHRKKLKPLFESCREMLRLEEHLLNLKQRLADESLEVVISETQALMAEVLEDSGIDLAPLNRELVDVAHRFSSRILVRSEMALAIMKRMKGDALGSHQHLASALFQATHVDDDPIEARILARLSVLALSTTKHEKAVRLSSAAIGLEALNESMKLKQHVVLAMAQFLNDEDYEGTISKVQALVQADYSVAMQALTELGESFLALNRPDFAIELFDEAMECSSTDGNIHEHLGELVLLAHRAMEDDDDVEVEGLRRVLDRIHEQTTQQQKAVEKTVEDISKRQESERPVEVSTDWQSSEVLLDDERPLYISAVVGEAAEEQLIVAQHPSLGTIGIWMPSSIQAPQPGAKITLSNSRVKVAQAPEKLAELHSLKALVAIENPEGLVFQSLTEDAKEELEEL